MDRHLLLALVALAAHAAAQIATPLGIKTCADDQPDVVECRRNALQEAVVQLAVGIPQIGAAPIDPLSQLPPLTWNSNSRGLALQFRLDNARHTGLGRSVVDNLQVDTVKNLIRVVAHIDGLNTIEGDYTLSGKVLGVPLDGSGVFKLSMNGGSMDVTYAGHIENGGQGHSYLNIDTVSVKLQLGQSYYELTGLFGDYEPLATPLGIKTCADDQPDVVECRRNALQEAVVLLAAGIPQIGAAPIDPLAQLPPLTWNSNSRGLALQFRLDNARHTGLGQSVVDNLQVDTVNKRIRVVTHIDGLNNIEGDYTLSGKVLGVPLDGSGVFKLSMYGSSVDVTYAGHIENGKQGQSYLKIDSVRVKLQLGQSYYELSGLFGDYEPLVHAGNMFINSVAGKVVEPEMLPTLEKWLAQGYLQHAQAVFSTVPYDQLFPKTSAYTGFYRAVFPQYF